MPNLMKWFWNYLPELVSHLISRIPKHLLPDLLKQFAAGRFWPFKSPRPTTFEHLPAGRHELCRSGLTGAVESRVFWSSILQKVSWNSEKNKSEELNFCCIVVIPEFVWLNQFSSSLSSSQSGLKSSNLWCFKENRRLFAMMSDATETCAGNVKQMALLYAIL